MSAVGDSLRVERLRTGRALEEIARATKIPRRFLEAIEAEDFKALPGLIFTRNFVRQYALFLELDPAPLLATLPAIDPESAPMPQPVRRVERRTWNPRWKSFAAFVLAAGAAVSAYVGFNQPHLRVFARPSTPAAAISPIAKPVSIRPVQVVLATREASWIQATADGQSIFTGLMKAGETRSVAADQLVKIRTGNAGGLDISLNGKQIESLGSVGQIAAVTLTAEGPRPGSAALPGTAKTTLPPQKLPLQP